MPGKHARRLKNHKRAKVRSNWAFYLFLAGSALILVGIFALVLGQIQQAQELKQAGKNQALHSQTASTQTTKSTSKTVRSSSKTSSSSAKTETKASSSGRWKKQSTAVTLPILDYSASNPETVEKHVIEMTKEGYYFLTPEEAYRALTENALPSSKVIWLTFDQGRSEFYTQIFPILKANKVKATNSVIINNIINALPTSLTVAQMQEMKQSGISFQSMSLNYPDFAVSEAGAQANELSVSKAYLDEVLAQDTLVFTYPAGSYSQTTLDLAAQTYKLALSKNEGLALADNGLLSLNRITVTSETTWDDLKTRITP